MILPTKHIPMDRALLTVGGTILTELSEPLTVSTLWARLRTNEVPYQTYTLALSFLYLIGSIDLQGDVIARCRS